jgi:hypothetical protein
MSFEDEPIDALQVLRPDWESDLETWANAFDLETETLDTALNRHCGTDTPTGDFPAWRSSGNASG